VEKRCGDERTRSLTVLGWVLRPEVVLCVQAGAGNGDNDVAAGGGTGSRGVRGGGQQGRGTGPGQGEKDVWRSPSRRWSGGGLHSGDGEVPCTGSRGGRTEQHVPEEEEERGGVRRTYVQN
jgi:hypothetical protein